MDDFDDDIWKIVIAALFALGAVLWLVGGFVTRVAGRWLDGERVVTLHQFGPLVWGEAVWQGGKQTYRGRALFGHVRLMRSDHGVQHLTSIGFTRQQVPALEGKATGHFMMRLRDGKLAGKFYGRKFSFDEQEIRSVTVVDPVERTWSRQPAG